VCLNDDYICHKEDGADKMYFVHSGYIEILQQNNVTPLIFFGKGAYFGEIGVLLTGKRSLSVRAKSNAVIYYIPKEEFCDLLDNYPKQRDFLREVA
jgi:CRP-like cAMP-binding protein